MAMVVKSKEEEAPGVNQIQVFVLEDHKALVEMVINSNAIGGIHFDAKQLYELIQMLSGVHVQLIRNENNAIKERVGKT